MKIIVITGNAAAGKSSILEKFSRNYPTYSADKVAHGLLSLEKTKYQLSSILGVSVEKITRNFLSEYVFSHPKKWHNRRKLEQYLHPKIHAEIIRSMGFCRRFGYKKIYIEIPLFYETLRYKKYAHEVKVAFTPEFLRIKRLKKRGLTTKIIDTLKKIQWRSAKQIRYGEKILCVKSF